MAHLLEGYDGPCRNVHGHSYKLEVTVIGTPLPDISNPKYGMVMDFGILKEIVFKEIANGEFCNWVTLSGKTRYGLPSVLSAMAQKVFPELFFQNQNRREK